MKLDFLFLLLGVTFGTSSANAQVRIEVPSGPFKPHERILATVTNSGKSAVTVCIEIGQTSKIGDEIQGTPYPFFVQQFVRNKWDTLLIGPDVGSFRASSVLKSGESLQFPFALSARGKMRLKMEYWPQEIAADKCPETKSAKTVSSNSFVIQ